MEWISGRGWAMGKKEGRDRAGRKMMSERVPNLVPTSLALKGRHEEHIGLWRLFGYHPSSANLSFILKDEEEGLAL